MLIKGVAKDTDVAVITILNVPDEPGMSFKIFGLLAQKNINVDIILQSTGRDGKKDISFTCAEGEAELAMRVLKESAHFSNGGHHLCQGLHRGCWYAEPQRRCFQDVRGTVQQ